MMAMMVVIIIMMVMMVDDNYSYGDDDDKNYNDGAYVKIYDNNHHKVWRARQPSHWSGARYAQNRGG